MSKIAKAHKDECRRIKRIALISTSAIIAGAGAISSAHATESVIYNFTGGTTDGGNPYAGLTDDGSGNLYGAAFAGGASGQGVIFKITTGGTFSALASLPGGGNGGGPTSPPHIPLAGTGVIFGTAAYGSVSAGVGSGYGTLYELTPSGSSYSYNYADFNGTSLGANPFGGLSNDSAGNLYGTAYNGGANGKGVIFEVVSGGTTPTRLYSFGASAHDGANPYAGVWADGSGNTYGTTVLGGSSSDGTLFTLPSGASAPTILHNFAGGSDGSEPRGDVYYDGTNLFGTTFVGGTSSDGTAFKAASGGAITILHPFSGGTTDGSFPYAGLTEDSSGNLWGTTSNGGAHGQGTIFELISTGGGSYLYSLKYSFSGGSGDGANPYGLLVYDSGTSSLFGTTHNGGTSGVGTVFQYTP